MILSTYLRKQMIVMIIKQLFKYPRYTLVGTCLLLCLLVWFMGPLLAVNGHVPLESAINRILLIASLILLYGVITLRQHLRDGTATTDHSSVEQEEGLRQNIKWLAQHYKLSNQHGTHIILGPEGCGKSSLLQHCELDGHKLESLPCQNVPY